MTGVNRKATFFVAIGLVAATVAMAVGTPDAANSMFPAFVRVVGMNAGVPDPFGRFSISVSDKDNYPISGSVVTLDFTNCTDMELCEVDGLTCRQVSGITNLNGEVFFTIVGAGLNPNIVFPSPGAGCIEIRADGYLLGNATANVYDLNGALGGAGNGVHITDLPLWLADWAGGVGPYRGRDDYSQNGSVGITDLPYWLALWGQGSSSGGCQAATYCP